MGINSFPQAGVQVGRCMQHVHVWLCTHHVRINKSGIPNHRFGLYIGTLQRLPHISW